MHGLRQDPLYHSGEARRVYDLLVIGAGPGGSKSAAVALSGGLSVAQLDQADFPRAKTCAGGLTVKSSKNLCGWPRVPILSRSHSFVFAAPSGEERHMTHHNPVLHFVDRASFDQSLVEQNKRSAGYHFFPNERVVSVEYDGLFQVQTQQRTFRSRQLVGADGAYSLVNRIFQISRPKGIATGIEIEVVPSPDSSFCQVPRFDFGAVDWGYGWVFPKRTSWSVGLYTLSPVQQGLKKRLEEYGARQGLGSLDVSLARAQRYPVGGFRLSAPQIPVYLVGDAGGFAEAVTGEGIYSALESGRLAGLTSIEFQKANTGPQSYYRRLKRGLLWDTAISWHLAQRFYLNPSRWIVNLKNPLLWRPLLQGYAEGASLSRCLGLALLFLCRSRNRAYLYE